MYRRELETLSKHNVSLSETIDKLLKKLEEKEQEIKHLQELLSSSVPVIGESEVSKIEVSDEEIIAEYQLRAIKQAAMVRDLTLDEVKRYDLLVKNKRLAQGNATVIDAKAKSLQGKNTEALLTLAKLPTKEEQ